MISGVSNASLLVATSVNALKKAVDSNEEALEQLINATSDAENGSESEGLDNLCVIKSPQGLLVHFAKSAVLSA